MYKECQKSGWIKYEGRDFLELGVHQYRRPAVILKLTLEMEEARQAPLMALLFDLTLSFIDTIFSCFAKVYILGRTLAIYCFEGKSIVASGSIDFRILGKEWRLAHLNYFKIFDSSPSAMGIAALEGGKFIEINESWTGCFGYQREEVIGRTSLELNLWAIPENRAGILNMLLKGHEVNHAEINYRTKSGEMRRGLVSARTIDLDGEKCALYVLNDITERKQMEKEVARLDRLNLVGEMASGIAHEIRNPIAVVRGFLQLYRGKVAFYQYRENIDLMIQEIDRANSIITEFLSLASNKAVDLKKQNLNSIIKDMSPSLQADAMVSDNYIRLELHEIPDFNLDEKETRQLITNLVKNGLEAMSPSGRLTIKTFMEDGQVVLAIEDQGNGIDPEVLEKVGTPFFSTKDNGTGLDLAVCFSIASRHNARIDVETGPSGTTFYVRFKGASEKYRDI